MERKVIVALSVSIALLMVLAVAYGFANQFATPPTSTPTPTQTSTPVPSPPSSPSSTPTPTALIPQEPANTPAATNTQTSTPMQPTPTPTPTSTPVATPVIIPMPSGTNFYLGNSKIYVVSATASYGNYPFPTVTDSPGEPPIATNGEPCLIINVTLRNDYSYQNPAPGLPGINSSEVNVALTAALFKGESQVNAKDTTNAFPLDSVFVNRAFAVISYGESAKVSIYMATNSTEITGFQLIPYYVSRAPAP
jgi:hypothetical protein